MNNYSNLALFKSKGRIFKEANSLYKTPFQRDRIIHSAILPIALFFIGQRYRTKSS